MSFEQELQSLPHGKEFCFIEKVIELTPGQEGVASYQISGEEEFLKGHFPGRPLWPGVIMIEAIAQLGGVVAQSDPGITPLEDLRLTSVKNAKILGSTTPGATLTIRAKVLGRLGPIIQVSGEVLDGETKLTSGIVMLSGTEKAE